MGINVTFFPSFCQLIAIFMLFIQVLKKLYFIALNPSFQLPKDFVTHFRKQTSAKRILRGPFPFAMLLYCRILPDYCSISAGSNQDILMIYGSYGIAIMAG
jgi:hypothetical protein